MTAIRAVLLDAHGTLVELEPPAPRLRRTLRERLGLDVTEREASAALAAEITYYRRHLQEGRDRASVDALRERCAEVLFEALPSAREVRLRGEIDRGLMTATLLESLRFRPFDDVAPALSALRALGLRLVVASNWDASLPDTLARVGILDALDGVVSSAACGAAKPAATLFEAALAVAGVAAGEAIHVGDSIAEDVAGARAAGIEPVFLLRDDQGVPDGVVTIRTLAELAPLLAARAAPRGPGAR